MPLIVARDLLDDILYQKPAFLPDRHDAARHNARTKQSRLRHNLPNVNLPERTLSTCNVDYAVDCISSIGGMALITYIDTCNSTLLVGDTLRHATLLPSVRKRHGAVATAPCR
jgi:hypothetical protein